MFDYLIKDGLIIDGSGEKAFKADVGLIGDRIAKIGDLKNAQAGKIIHAKGLAISPGFIDIHSHHDLYVIDQDRLDKFESFVRQGVTTCVVGNCGWSPAPCIPEKKQMLLDLIRSMGAPVKGLYWNTMAEYLSYLDSQDLICNLAQLVGHGAVRIAVMGDNNRFCTPDESRQMQEMVRESLAAGCVGLSSGLMYYPGMNCHTDELVDLANVLAEFERPYATHLRGYCSTLENSIEEALTIVTAANVPLQISHLHAIPFFGKTANYLYEIVNIIEAINSVIPLPPLPNPALDKGFKRIQTALEQGMDIGMDIVPYTLGNTTATILFPPWANQGGKSKLLDLIRNPEAKRRMEKEMLSTVPKWPHWEEGSWSDPYISAMGWKPIRVLSVQSEVNQWAKGKSFPEIAKEWKTTEFSALCRMMLEEDGEVAFTFGLPTRPWIEKMFTKILSHPLMSIGADSILPKTGAPPPSAFGCFPRVLGHYSRELGLFSIEEAIRKMTGLPASRYKLDRRGLLRDGYFADIVMFDPDTIGENFTPNDVPIYASGINSVFLNGNPVLLNGDFNRSARPGRVLRAS